MSRHDKWNLSLSVKFDELSFSVKFERVSFSVWFAAVVDLSLGLVFGDIVICCVSSGKCSGVEVG